MRLTSLMRLYWCVHDTSFDVHIGDLSRAAGSDGWKLCEDLQEWIDSCQAAEQCDQVFASARCATYLMVLQAYGFMCLYKQY